MLDSKQFNFAISQIAEEKNIPEDKIIEVIESSVAAAYKKDYGEKSQIITAKLDRETGDFHVYQYKTIVVVDKEGYVTDQTEVDEEGNPRKIRFNPDRHIPYADAQEMYDQVEEGQEVVEELEPREDFGRVAAQTAKQVLMQRVREIERLTAYDEYKDRIGEIITGIVQRVDRGIVFVELGKGVGLLFPSEQVKADNYRVGNRYKFYIKNVEQTDRDPNILLSRRDVEFVKTLFSLEVPEIFSGTVEIKAIAREAGSRTKMAVVGHGEGIDAVGSCVGQKGTRVQSVINELGGEKIDVISYSDDVEEFIRVAIAPAEVKQMTINDLEHTARLIIPDDQLSLAIGGRGQNVRLASQLTGYNLDIKGVSESEQGEENQEPPEDESPKEESEPLSEGEEVSLEESHN